jgi:phosphopantothenoylcysteine decarboxylase/phosphopantothenate--cysteine ligase
VLFAPAMNTDMYNHPATQANIETLRARGCHFVGPGEGRLACGTIGVGRMIDPMTVIEAALPLISDNRDLAGKRVLITSGGNREPIDPARFIGNRSSGKMGRAIALEALVRGASVTVVNSPAETPMPYGAEVVPVETAAEMAEAVMARVQDADIIIGAAAVADYRVEQAARQKLKRKGEPLALTLVENVDILAEVGARKRAGQILVGFAAETDDLLANASAKLKRKYLDLIVANQIGEADSGFGADTVKAAFIRKSGDIEQLPLMTKEDLAERLFDFLATVIPASSRSIPK